TCSSVTTAFPLPTTSCSLGVASDTGSLIITPPTGVSQHLSLILPHSIQHVDKKPGDQEPCGRLTAQD
ncbi:hypothetical protein Tco_0376478, partial [Tanacetum coccineum]